jgi:hypothetical protein
MMMRNYIRGINDMRIMGKKDVDIRRKFIAEEERNG